MSNCLGRYYFISNNPRNEFLSLIGEFRVSSKTRGLHLLMLLVGLKPTLILRFCHVIVMWIVVTFSLCLKIKLLEDFNRYKSTWQLTVHKQFITMANLATFKQELNFSFLQKQTTLELYLIVNYTFIIEYSDFLPEKEAMVFCWYNQREHFAKGSQFCLQILSLEIF